MNRALNLPRWTLLWFSMIGLAIVPPAWGLDDNENSAPTGWWFYTGQTFSQVGSTITKNNARIRWARCGRVAGRWADGGHLMPSMPS